MQKTAIQTLNQQRFDNYLIAGLGIFFSVLSCGGVYFTLEDQSRSYEYVGTRPARRVRRNEMDMEDSTASEIYRNYQVSAN